MRDNNRRLPLLSRCFYTADAIKTVEGPATTPPTMKQWDSIPSPRVCPPKVTYCQTASCRINAWSSYLGKFLACGVPASAE